MRLIYRDRNDSSSIYAENQFHKTGYKRWKATIRSNRHDIPVTMQNKTIKYQRIESISNFAASIDIFKVFYLTIKHIVIKNRTFSA